MYANIRKRFRQKWTLWVVSIVIVVVFCLKWRKQFEVRIQHMEHVPNGSLQCMWKLHKINYTRLWPVQLDFLAYDPNNLYVYSYIYIIYIYIWYYVCVYFLYVCMYVCMYVMYVCNVCMYGMYVWYVCMVCMYGMYVWYVCMVCMYGMYVWYVCMVCMYGMYVWYVCMVCMCIDVILRHKPWLT